MKRTGLNIICSLLLAGGMCACTATPKQTEEIKWSERMAQSEMQRFPEPWMIEKAKKPRWGYTHGLVVKSMLEEWKHTGDTAYYNYAKIYADSLIDTDGKIKTMKYLSFNIDNINAGKILFDFYEKTGDGRYKVAMDTLRKQLAEQPRTSEGGFWHKLVYPHQMWLDGIFMASPYLAQYGNVFKDTTVNADIVNQIKLIARKTYDTALRCARNPYVAVVACDMVLASPSLVVAEALEMTRTGADVVVPVNKHGFEPFHAIYRRLGCLPAVREALNEGEKRAQVFFNQVNVCEFPQKKVLEAEPMGGCFMNANTPDELAALERIIQDRIECE